MGRSKEKSNNPQQLSNNGQRGGGKPVLTIQRQENQTRQKPSSKTKSHSGGCRDCGGNHRTSKCPQYTSSSRRHNRSRSRSPATNNNNTSVSRSRKTDRSSGKRRGSGSPPASSSRHHHRGSNQTTSSHRHHGTNSGRSRQDEHRSSIPDRHHRHSSSRKSDHAEGGKSSSKRRGSSRHHGSDRRRSRHHRTSGSKSDDRSFTTPAKQDPLSKSSSHSKPQDNADRKIDSAEKNQMTKQSSAQPFTVLPMIDSQMTLEQRPMKPPIDEGDDATFGEPISPINSNADDRAGESEEEADAQSSSNYSSSSQSSCMDEGEESTTAALNNTQKQLSPKTHPTEVAADETQAVSSQAQLPAPSTSSQPVDALNSQLKDLIGNDDKLSSISSLFLSDKDLHNSTGFAKPAADSNTQAKKASVAAIREEDLDDIDKISSPGRPRVKPKSINSPTMLSQNINQTSLLLQQLTQQQQGIVEQRGGPASTMTAPFQQQQIPQLQQQPHQIPHQMPLSNTNHHHHVQSAQPYVKPPRSNNNNQQQVGQYGSGGQGGHANGGSRMPRYSNNGGGHSQQMEQTNSRHSFSRNGSSNGGRYSTSGSQNDYRSGSSHPQQQRQQYQGNNHQPHSYQQPQQQHQPQQQSPFYLGGPQQQMPQHQSCNSYNMGGLNNGMQQQSMQQMPQQAAFQQQHLQGGIGQMAPPQQFAQQQQMHQNPSGGNMQGIGDLTNYEESVRRLENTSESMHQKQILRKISLKGARIDVRLFVGQVPRIWKDENIMTYFKKFGTINEARIIRDKYDGSHRGCAFLKCQSFHEAEDILNNHLPKLKNENGEFQDDPRRPRNGGSSFRNSGRRSQGIRDNENSFDDDEKGSDARMASRLQVRYADGELERLGIVNLESQEQSKLYCSNISKRLNQDQVTELFQTFGDVEELYLFRDQGEQFRGSCFIKYVARKQALKAVLYLNRKGVKDNKYAAALVDATIDCQSYQNQFPEGVPVLDVRFADKKRKENFSLIYQTKQNQQLLNSWQVQSKPNHQRGGGLHHQHNQQPQQQHSSQQMPSGGHLGGSGQYSGGSHQNHSHQGGSSSSMRSNGNGRHHQTSQHQSESHHHRQHGSSNDHNMNSMAASTENPAEKSSSQAADHQKQQLMMGPLQVFLRSLLIDPSNQHLFLEYFSQENGGKPYYLDTQTNVSQWNKPSESKADGTTVIIHNGIKVNEQMKQWLASAEGQKVVQNFQQSQQQMQQQASASYNDGAMQQQYSGGAQGYDSGAKGQGGNQRAINLITQGLYKQGPTGANLFIFHLPNEWSDLDLFYFFNTFELGTIVSVRIMTDKYSGRSKGYGFVSYDNPRSAEDAIRKVNGKQALGKRLKVELKKGGIATHLGGDVSLSKEDTQMIRKNMPDESYDENSSHSMRGGTDGVNGANNSVSNPWEGSNSQQRYTDNQNSKGGQGGHQGRDSNKRQHSFAMSNGGSASCGKEQTTDKVMQQILGKQTQQANDSLASMTNLIYEGTTTGANTTTQFGDIKTD